MSPSMRTHPSSRSTRSGFSIIEFLVVAMILGVGLLGLAALSTISIRGYSGSRTRDVASNLAGSVLDRLALDGRLSSNVRSDGGVISGSALVANATDGTLNVYADPQTGFTTFDLQGQPSSTTPVFSISWVRRAPKTGISPAPTSLTATAEVVVNVQWNEALKNNAGVTAVFPRYLSFSRSIRY